MPTSFSRADAKSTLESTIFKLYVVYNIVLHVQKRNLRR